MIDNIYIELGALSPYYGFKRNFIVKNDPEIIKSHRQKFNNTDVFSSVSQYDSMFIRDAYQFGPMYFDLDGEDALNDTKKLVEFLRQHGCPEQSICIFFSGNKGFHVIIPFESLGIEKNLELNNIFGLIARDINTKCTLKSLDLKIYDKVRLFRLPNSINGKSNLYKIPLYLDELSIEIKGIKEMAGTAREDVVKDEPALWKEFISLFEKSKNYTVESDSKSEVLSLYDVTSTDEGSRDNNMLRLANSLLSRKYHEEESWFTMNQVNLTFRPPLDKLSMERIFNQSKIYISAQKVSQNSTSNSINESKKYSSLLSLNEILSLPEIQEEWIVDQIVLQNGITTVSGLPNHFKSLFVQMLVKSVACGIPFLNKFAVTQGPVLIIDREIPTIRLKKRWNAIGSENPNNIFFYKYSDPFKLDNRQDVNRLEELIDEYKFKLIVIDTFNRSHSGKETNSYSEIAGVFEPLKKNLEKTSIILIHHSNKDGYKKDVPTPEELMGSTDFAAETDLLFTIRKKDNNTLAVHNLKAKDSPLIEPFVLKLITHENGGLDLQYQGALELPTTPKQDRGQKIIDFLKSGIKFRKEIIDYMTQDGEKEKTINNDLTLLKKQGKIGSKMIGNESQYFLIEMNRVVPEQPFLISHTLDTRNQGNVIHEQCFSCGSTNHWLTNDGRDLCINCHPPFDEKLE